MKKLLIPLLLLAACSGDGDGNRTTGDNQAAPAAQSSARGGGGGALTNLVGLYEGGSAARPNRMCVVDDGGALRFGLVVWGGNDHSCSGSGSIAREGAALRLSMAGDQSCTISATISGNTVTFPAQVPTGCSYYCGTRARMSGASLTQTGTTEADAGKAQDLVGEPLCGGG